eukprot:796205-Rhodomonas_salina.2
MQRAANRRPPAHSKVMTVVDSRHSNRVKRKGSGRDRAGSREREVQKTIAYASSTYCSIEDESNHSRSQLRPPVASA